MSLSSHRQELVVCWNCDRALDRVTELELTISPGRIVSLGLCSDCFQSAYLPLASEAAELRVPASQGGTILVVEDDPGMRGLLQTVLEIEGYEVRSAANGAEALEKVREQAPDAIVLDLRMPTMSGQEFLRAWRQTSDDTAVPVIAISAHHPTLTAAELGVQSFLPKPFEYKTLIGTVAALVGADTSAANISAP